MRRLVTLSIVLALAASCGGRSALDVPVVPACTPSNSPTTLMTLKVSKTILSSVDEVFALASDDSRLFVAQTPAPRSGASSTVWSMDGYGANRAQLSDALPLSDLFPSGGGVFFATGGQVEWAGPSGARTVASITQPATRFSTVLDPSREYAFSTTNVLVQRVDLTTGTASTVYTAGATEPITSLAVTEDFVHVITSMTSGNVVDYRFNFAGVLQDSVALGPGSPSAPPVGGGTTLCACRGDGEGWSHTLVCLSDDGRQP